ncbi:Astacin-like metalloprotease toxin [Dinothrombium tinctorium]|uniref:Metalloendopeptidase n=1 Tax=Dinothrombium tinctorium TaxID=1965070 RepID=A0A443QCG7_9ACAR|nr:Astacin-like metalloprotease toxin [Dinothrombium tinctorium]
MYVFYFLNNLMQFCIQKKFSLRNAVPEDDPLWPYGTIPYKIHPHLGKFFNLKNFCIEPHRESIVEAIDHFHEHTCIRFVERTDEDDYLHLISDEGLDIEIIKTQRRLINKIFRCYSSIGRTGGEQTLSLDYGCICKGTIIHELMHTLGFYHEQNRSDRDKYIIVLYDRINATAKHEFNRLAPDKNRLLSPYDYDSIMHYASNAFSKDGRDTMIPRKEGVILTHPCFKSKLSKFDIVKISKLYGCSFD